MPKLFASAALLLLLTNVIANGFAYKILFMLPMGTKSHKVVFDPLAEELARRGHEVTMISSVTTNKNRPNLTNIVLHDVAAEIERSNVNFFNMKTIGVSAVTKLFSIFSGAAEATFGDPQILDIIKNPRDANNRPRYDLVVVDGVVNEASLAVAHHLAVPTMYLCPTVLLTSTAWALNIPYPVSYIPMASTLEQDYMAFKDRAINMFGAVALTVGRRLFYFPMLDEIISRYIPGSPPVQQLEKQVAFVITNSHFSIYPRVPTMPYVLEAGGLHCVKAKPLPKDLEDFLQSSGEEGAIFFSLGSITQGDMMPAALLANIIKAFEQLPQKILWKYESEIEGLPKNIKLIKWAPQQDLLAHPKMRVFLTHGGGMSTQEAAYHGCPMVAIPLAVDQVGNAAIAVSKGFAKSMDWETLTTEELVQTIREVIHDKSYKENALKVSTLMKDRPLPPVDSAAYWIEYIIRHEGAPHLKSGAEHLNFFQYFLLDVIGAVVLALSIVIVILFLVLRAVYKLIFGKKLTKTIKKKTN